MLLTPSGEKKQSAAVKDDEEQAWNNWEKRGDALRLEIFRESGEGCLSEARQEYQVRDGQQHIAQNSAEQIGWKAERFYPESRIQFIMH